MEIINTFVVEDDLDTQRALKQTFTHLTEAELDLHFTQTSSLAKKALQKYAKTRKEGAYSKAGLIILDLSLPEDYMAEPSSQTGLDLCRWIKQNPDLNDIPIVFLSNFKESDFKDKALRYYASDFIEKTLEEEHILARIDAVLFNQKAIRRQCLKKTSLKTPNAQKPVLNFLEQVDKIIHDNISDQNLNRQMLVEKVAQEMGNGSQMCLRTLTTKLNDAIKMSPANYIKKIRVEYGCLLLEKGIDPGKVAEKCGCNNQTFRRAFKLYKGVSPAQYKRTL